MVTWIVGAVINVVGSILINGGTNVMKLGHNKRKALEVDGGVIPPIRKIRAWQIGVTLFIVGNLMNFGSFAFAAQSLLAALGSVQFIANVAFGRLILGEQITKRIVLATALIVAGCIILVSFGNHSSETYTSKQLQEFYTQTPYIIYLCLMFTALSTAYLIYRQGNALRKRRGQTMETVSKMWQRLLPICFSCFAALLGTQSVLFSKALSLLLRTTITGDSQLGSWFTWINLLLFIICAAFWVTRLNMALKLFPAVIIVPMMQIAWTLFSILNGMTFYEEYKGYTTLKAVMFALGVLVVFAGVFTLTSRSVPADSASYMDLQEELVTDELEGGAAESGDEDVSNKAINVQLSGDSSGRGMRGLSQEDDESFPLSPTRSHQSAAISRKSPPASAEPPAAEHTTATPAAHHRRGSSILQDLATDFSINFGETRQVLGVAERPIPPYAFPKIARTSPPGPLSSTPQDVEMGQQQTGAVSSAARQNRPKAASDFSANPFAGGLEDGRVASAQRPSAGSVSPATLQRESMASGASFRSEAEPLSPDLASVFGRRDLLADDDPLSPTWDAQDDFPTRRVSQPFSLDGQGVVSKGKALLRTLTPHR